MPPWEVKHQELTPWRLFVWRTRRDVYTAEVVAKRERDKQELEARFNGSS